MVSGWETAILRDGDLVSTEMTLVDSWRGRGRSGKVYLVERRAIGLANTLCVFVEGQWLILFVQLAS